MTFSDLYDEMIKDIEVVALSQRVRDHDYDDVVAEMIGCLWKAWLTHHPGKGEFKPYWWSLWLNRRADLTRYAGRVKRPSLVTTDLPPEAWGVPLVYEHRPLPMPSESVAQTVWTMIATGHTVQEILRLAGITKRRYYSLIHQWRTPEVKEALLMDS